MATQWFICPYKLRDKTFMSRPMRYCAMDDYTARIEKDNGAWVESEVGDGYAIVKVRAEEETLEGITGDGFVPIALSGVDDEMSSLGDEELAAIRAAILAMGYTEAEIAASLGEIAKCTLGDVLTFCASRRAVLAYDEASESMVSTDVYESCKPVSDVDEAVADDISATEETIIEASKTVTG
jgi:hypothetical protein